MAIVRAEQTMASHLSAKVLKIEYLKAFYQVQVGIEALIWHKACLHPNFAHICSLNERKPVKCVGQYRARLLSEPSHDLAAMTQWHVAGSGRK